MSPESPTSYLSERLVLQMVLKCSNVQAKPSAVLSPQPEGEAAPLTLPPDVNFDPSVLLAIRKHVS